MDTFDNICKIFQRYLTPRQEFKAALTRGRSPCTHTIHKLDISMICAYWCFLDWGNSTMDLLKHPICHSTFGQKSFDCFQLLMHHWFGFCFTWAFMLCFVFFGTSVASVLSGALSSSKKKDAGCTWGCSGTVFITFWKSPSTFGIPGSNKASIFFWDGPFNDGEGGAGCDKGTPLVWDTLATFFLDSGGVGRSTGASCFRFILLCRSHGWSVWLWHIHIGIDVTKYPLPYRFICSFFPHMRQTFPCEHVTSLCVLRSKVCCCTLWPITDEQPKTPCQAVSVWRYRNHGNSMLVDQRLDQGPVWFQPYWQLAMDIDRLMLHTDSKNIQPSTKSQSWVLCHSPLNPKKIQIHPNTCSSMNMHAHTIIHCNPTTASQPASCAMILS